MKKLMAFLSAAVLAVLGVSVISSASAAPGFANTVTYSGQGLDADGGISDNRCADGTEPYILWVLTANKATSADITLPSGTFAMVQSGNGAFKYTSPYQDPSDLIGVAVASYNGVQTNAQFVISHGCEGDTPTSTPPPTS